MSILRFRQRAVGQRCTCRSLQRDDGRLQFGSCRPFSHRRRRDLISNLVLGGCALTLIASCERRPYAVHSVPNDVVSLRGELVALRTPKKLVDPNLTVNLAEQAKRFGTFDEVNVYRHAEARWTYVTTVVATSTKGGVTVRFAAEPGLEYLIQPKLTDLVANYHFICHIRHFHVERLPKICTQILCADQPVSYGDVQRQFPEETAGFDNPGEFPLGGFGGGSICEVCGKGGFGAPDLFIPDPDCGGGGGGTTQSACGGTVVFSSRSGDVNAPSQIFRLDLNQTTATLLSTDPVTSEIALDVSRDGRTVLGTSAGTAASFVFKMNPDGSNRAQIGGLSLSDDGFRWWSDGAVILAFHRIVGPGDTGAIFLFDPAGQFVSPNPKQITFPGSGESDLECFDPSPGGKKLLFARRTSSGQIDLFTANPDDGASVAAVNVTNTLDADETFPVFAHDGRKLAHRIVRGTDENIVVHPVDAAGEVGAAQEFDLDNALYENVSAIDFTLDNSCLVLTVQVKEVDTQVPVLRSEIIVLNVADGVVRRVTSNAQDEVRALTVSLTP